MKQVFTVLQLIFALPFLVLLFVSTIVFGFVSPLAHNITSSETVKNWLRDAHVYELGGDSGFDFALQKIQKTARDAGKAEDVETLSRGLLNEGDARANIAEIFPPGWIQAQAEKTIDDFYVYLAGENDFTLTIDLAGREDSMREALGRVFKNRINSLPTCKDAGDMAHFNLFTATCIPSGLEKETLLKEINTGIQKLPILNNSGVQIKEVHLSRADENPIGRIFLFAREIPKVLFALIAIATSLLFFFLPGQKRKFKIIGATVGSAGAVIALTSFFAKTQFPFLFDTFITARIPENAQPFLSLGERVLSVIYQDILGSTALYGAIIIFTGIGIYFLSRLSIRPLFTHTVFGVGLLAEGLTIATTVMKLKELGLFQ